MPRKRWRLSWRIKRKNKGKLKLPLVLPLVYFKMSFLSGRQNFGAYLLKDFFQRLHIGLYIQRMGQILKFLNIFSKLKKVKNKGF